jgi:uncharacterized protein DUF5677
MQVIYARIMEIHRRIEALYPRVEERAAYFRTFMRADSALPKASGKPMGVRVDPIVCALAIKAATTKQAIAALCELGHGDDAFALTRVLMENACLLEWLIRGDGHRRLDTYALFTSVMHERIVAIVERFRDRFIAAGADLQVKSDPYHRAIAEHVFGDARDDRPTRELSVRGVTGKLPTTEHPNEHDAIRRSRPLRGADDVRRQPIPKGERHRSSIGRTTWIFNSQTSSLWFREAPPASVSRSRACSRPRGHSSS